MNARALKPAIVSFFARLRSGRATDAGDDGGGVHVVRQVSIRHVTRQSGGAALAHRGHACVVMAHALRRSIRQRSVR